MGHKIETIKDGWFYNRGDTDPTAWDIYKIKPNDYSLEDVRIDDNTYDFHITRFPTSMHGHFNRI